MLFSLPQAGLIEDESDQARRFIVKRGTQLTVIA
jgi:hypothetical protein